MSITQDATRTVIAAAQAHARELGLLITVAVVDTGGLLMGLDRMDGAPPLSAQIAEAKAQGPPSGTATVMRSPRSRRSVRRSSRRSAR